MTVALLFLSAIMAVVVGWLIRQSLNTTPWVEQSAAEHAKLVDTPPTGALALTPAQMALGFFLCVVTSLFALMVSAYFMRMMNPDWASPALPMLLWFNTALLVASSVAVHWTRNATRRWNLSRVRTGLLVSGALTLAFVVGQLQVWQMIASSDTFLVCRTGIQAATSPGTLLSNPATAFFYMFTAAHAVHLLGGLWVWARASLRCWGAVDARRVRTSVDLCTVYWHYLLVLWLALFGLLLFHH